MIIRPYVLWFGYNNVGLSQCGSPTSQYYPFILLSSSCAMYDATSSA